MTIEVEYFDKLDAVAADAAGALDRAAQPSLFARLDWFRLVAHHTPPAGQLCVARARSAAGAAWLFLAVARGRAEALANWYSLRVEAPCAGSAAERRKLLTALAKSLRRKLHRVDLSPLNPDSLLPAAFRAAGWIVRTSAGPTDWDIDVGGENFDSYWNARPGQLRSTARRKAKAAALDIAVHRRFDAATWADYETVYASSWKGEEGSPAMLRALAEQEAAAGTLRLGIAKRDGKPVAAQLWLIEGGVATIHKLAYDEAEKAHSPGTLLSAAMFRSAIDEDRVERIDFGTGDDGYKRDWMERRRDLVAMTAFNPRSARGLAGAARAGAAALVRRRRSR